MTDLAERLNPVLQRHLTSATALELDLLIRIFASIMVANREKRFFRQNDMEIADAIASLTVLVSTLEEAATVFDQLNVVAREVLSRTIIGLDDVPEFEVKRNTNVLLDLGYRQRVQDDAATIKAIGSQAVRAIEVLKSYKKKTTGRPPAEGARAIADMCAIAYGEYVGCPAQPFWDHYKSGPSGDKPGPSGDFFKMVRDVFKAIGISETPRVFAKQAALAYEIKGKKTSRKK